MPLSEHSGGFQRTLLSFVSLQGKKVSTKLSLAKCHKFPPFHALEYKVSSRSTSAAADSAWVPVSPADTVTTACEQSFWWTKPSLTADEKNRITVAKKCSRMHLDMQNVLEHRVNSEDF